MKTHSFIKLIYSDLIRFQNSPNKLSKIPVWFKVFHPKFSPVLLIRISQLLYRIKIFRPFSFVSMFINFIIFGIEVTPKCQIGLGLYIPHSSGTVIGASKIGDNVTIFQGVTLGAKFAETEFVIGTRPTIGNGVVIGAGAKVLGNISIGDNSVISANSLVTESVPTGVTMIGVPAVIKYRNNV